MGAAGGLDDPVFAVELAEAGVGIGLEHPGERLQVPARPLAFPVGAVAEEDR